MGDSIVTVLHNNTRGEPRFYCSEINVRYKLVKNRTKIAYKFYFQISTLKKKKQSHCSSISVYRKSISFSFSDKSKFPTNIVNGARNTVTLRERTQKEEERTKG